MLAYMDESSNQIKYNNYYKLFTKLRKLYKCMDVQLYACTCVHHLCTCMHAHVAQACMHACL